MSCTDCGRKGGCDDRKQGLAGALSGALAGLYPTRRWGDRDDTAATGSAAIAVPLADDLASKVGAMTLFRPGAVDEYCDYVYVLGIGRQPSVLEIREGVAAWDPATDGPSGAGPLDELYLRVALSSLAPFAAVQQVALRAQHAGQELVITESPRAGVFDPVLLSRMQRMVAVFARWNLRNIDFGEITNPPDQFDPGDYSTRFGGIPAVANYLFYPQPATTVSTTVIGPWESG